MQFWITNRASADDDDGKRGEGGHTHGEDSIFTSVVSVRIECSGVYLECVQRALFGDCLELEVLEGPLSAWDAFLWVKGRRIVILIQGKAVSGPAKLQWVAFAGHAAAVVFDRAAKGHIVIAPWGRM